MSSSRILSAAALFFTMEKSTLQEFHAAMYAKYPGISWQTCQALYNIYYNITPVTEDQSTNEQTKTKKTKKK